MVTRPVTTRRRVLQYAAAAPVAAGAGLALPAARRSARAQTEVRIAFPPSSPAETSAFEALIEEFNGSQGDVRVNVQSIPSEYPTKLQTDLAAGTAADIFAVDSILAPDLINAGVMLPLDPYMAQSGFAATDYYPGLIGAFQANGQTFGLPKDFSTLAMVYDTAAFESAGITAAPTNWDEFRTTLQTLADATGQPPLVYGPAFDRYIVFLYQAGASVLNEDRSQVTIDSEQARQALDYYYSLYEDGLAATFVDIGAQWPGDAFSKDQAAVVLEGNWMLPFMAENAPDKQFSIAELPAGPAGKATMGFTVSWSINAASPAVDAAWQAVAFLTGPDGMAKWSTNSGLLPSRPAVAEQYIAQFPERAAFLAGGEYARPFQFGAGGLKFNNDANSEIQALFAGLQDVDETVTKMAERAQQDIRLAQPTA